MFPRINNSTYQLLKMVIASVLLLILGSTIGSAIVIALYDILKSL